MEQMEQSQSNFWGKSSNYGLVAWHPRAEWRQELMDSKAWL